MLRLIATAAVAAITLCAQAPSLLEQRINELRRTSTAIAGGEAGIHVVQAATGKVLYSSGADQMLTPASNTKLFSTALALSRLGPSYTVKTRVAAASAPDAQGRVAGPIVLEGVGDPTMSFMQVPYDKDAKLADPLAGIESLAEAVVARGVRSIAGDVIGDDTAFPGDYYPPGWELDDAIWDYGAPVSALSVADNTIRIEVVAGDGESDPALVTLEPSLPYYTVVNRVRVTATGKNKIDVRRSGRQLELSGVLSRAAGAWTDELAVDDPPLFAASALYDALTRRGVAITGQPVARRRAPDAPPVPPAQVLLAERVSPPLVEWLRMVDKISQNLWAEMVLRQVSRARGGDASRESALDELKAFLTEIGIDEKDYRFEDGSGLSRLTLVKPEAVVRLLRAMRNSKVADAWVSLMPVGASDGSLERRFHRDPAAHAIHAKTGSMSAVNSLSGYAESATFGEVVFSIIVNHTTAKQADVRDFIDKIGLLLVE